MAVSVSFCASQHQVIAFFGWECPLCLVRDHKQLPEELREHSVNDLRRAVVKDYNRIFYVHGEV
jgi:hypothetical protein